MPEGDEALVERLFDALNRRDVGEIASICDEGVEFFSSADGAFGRPAPYLGPAGLRDYAADAARAWEELLMTVCEVHRRGGLLLVHGRVYARSRELGIRDMPAAWIWELRDGRFLRGEAFPDPQLASARFAAVPA